MAHDELVKKMAETLQSEVRRMLLENQCDYDTLAAAALTVARVAIKREALEEAIDLLNSLGDHGSANFYASAIEALMEK
jgi:hypothetical protein